MNTDPSDQPAMAFTQTCQRVGIAADHGGFELKEYLVKMLRAAGHEVNDFGDSQLKSDDDYPDFVIPLARALAAAWASVAAGLGHPLPRIK
jgi:ribose 5-phosphate isomerase RpiB